MAVEYRGCVENSIAVRDGKRTVRRDLLYFCTGGESLSDVLNHETCPERNDLLPGSGNLRCLELEARSERSGGMGKVTVQCVYRVPEAGAFAASGEETVEYGKAFDVRISPLENMVPFLFSYDSVDENGNPSHPVRSTSGAMFDLSTVEISMLLRFSYYVRSFQPGWIQEFTDTVNLSEVPVCGLTVPAEKGLVRNLDAETVSVGEKIVVKMNAELELSKHGFRRRVPNRGYYCKIMNNPARVYSTYNYATGEVCYGPLEKTVAISAGNYPVSPVDDPVWLNADGTVKSRQDDLSDALSLEFREKRSSDWTPLSLPSSSPW